MDSQTSTSGSGAGQPAGSSPVTQDTSVIDLRNIPDTTTPSSAAPVAEAPLFNLAPASPIAPVAAAIPAAPSANSTPAVDPKIAAEFGLTDDQLVDIGKKYTIPESVKTAYPDLVALLVKTESMNDEERDYWFQVLPVMNDEQIVKLRTILVNEREQLKKIDSEYDSEMKKLNEVHKSEWNAFEIEQKRTALRQAEASHEEGEASKEDELLKKLEEIENT